MQDYSSQERSCVSWAWLKSLLWHAQAKKSQQVRHFLLFSIIASKWPSRHSKKEKDKQILVHHHHHHRCHIIFTITIITIIIVFIFVIIIRMNRFRGPFAPSAASSRASASTKCQKCLKLGTALTTPVARSMLILLVGVLTCWGKNYGLGHYSYECKATTTERPYISRPSRTQQLLNPTLRPELTESTLPPDVAVLKKKGTADDILKQKQKERERERERERDVGRGDRGRKRRRDRYASFQ